MLREGTSWLGGLALAGLVIGGCATGAGKWGEGEVKRASHTVDLVATEKDGDGWDCAVEPEMLWIDSGDTVTFSGARLPDPAVAEARVVVRPAPQKLGKHGNTARPTNPAPYSVEKGKPASMGAVRGTPGAYWIYAADFRFQRPGGGPPETCEVDPVVCVGEGQSDPCDP